MRSPWILGRFAEARLTRVLARQVQERWDLVQGQFLLAQQQQEELFLFRRGRARSVPLLRGSARLQVGELVQDAVALEEGARPSLQRELRRQQSCSLPDRPGRAERRW